MTDARWSVQNADSRAGAFIARHGHLVQVELDALPPDVLHDLYQAAVHEFWDESAYAAVMAHEADDRDLLRAVIPAAGA